MPTMTAPAHRIAARTRPAHVFPFYDPPVNFITITTAGVRPILANADVHEAFRRYALRGAEHRRAIGHYIIMPDHINPLGSTRRRLPGEHARGRRLDGVHGMHPEYSDCVA